MLEVTPMAPEEVLVRLYSGAKYAAPELHRDLTLSEARQILPMNMLAYEAAVLILHGRTIKVLILKRFERTFIEHGANYEKANGVGALEEALTRPRRR